MELKQIFQMKKIYEEFLEVEKINTSCYEKFKESFGLKADKEYRNPFYRNWDFQKSIQKVRDNILSEIKRVFNNQYPNVEVENIDNFIEEKTNEHGYKEKTLIILFDKIIEYLVELETNKERLATQYLVKNSLKLIPYNLKGSYSEPKRFKAEDIVKNNKLSLWCGYGYSSPNTENILYIKKLINVIINGINPAIAEEYENINFNYFKNGRVDIQLKSKKETLKVGKFLEAQQDVKQ